jgi:NTP pyrophosphatase (non-canonical NTP hydrolase)
MDPHTSSVHSFFDQLDRYYDHYLAKNGIKPDREFYILKMLEELGEFASILIAAKGNHPKIDKSTTTQRLEEEAADLLCQTIILLRRLNLSVWPTINNKWLEGGQPA